MFPKGDKKFEDLFSPLLRRPNSDVLDLHIRTLSSVLYIMSAADAPSSTRGGDVPAFLRDIATFLTRGSSGDKEGKQVVAVTGTIEQDSVEILVVTENPPNAIQNQSQAFSLGFVPVEKNPGTFQEVLET